MINIIGSGVFVKKNAVFDRQLKSTPKNVMFCKATVVGLNVPQNLLINT
jgi:hypothetical protein